MTKEQFESWAYQRLKLYLDDMPFTADERVGVSRVKAFLAGLEGDQTILVNE